MVEVAIPISFGTVSLGLAWVAWTRWLVTDGPKPDRWIPRVIAANGVALIAIWLIRLATGALPN